MSLSAIFVVVKCFRYERGLYEAHIIIKRSEICSELAINQETVIDLYDGYVLYNVWRGSKQGLDKGLDFIQLGI